MPQLKKQLSLQNPPKQRSEVKGGGVKFDGNKPPLDLLPYEAEEAIAEVMAFGEGKYGTANWANGIHYSRLIAATLRHLGSFRKGVDLDHETGLNHVAHAATNLAMLLWMIKNRPDMDNRWINKIKE